MIVTWDCLVHASAEDGKDLGSLLQQGRYNIEESENICIEKKIEDSENEELEFINKVCSKGEITSRILSM